MTDRERLVAEINEDLKARAKADPRPIRKIVSDALEREFSTAKTAAVERRIDEKEQRIQTLKREINDRQRELAAEKDELAQLESQLESYTNQKETLLSDARDALEGIPHKESNPAVENWADKLGYTPAELLEKL